MDKPVILLTFIALGLAYLGMIQVVVITGLATAAVFYSSKNGNKSKPSKNSDVKIQPIKVKRKWDEDVESIYPKKMNIVMDTPKTGIKDDLGDSLEGMGKIIGNIAKKAKSEDD
ncbi:MAG: hypothetical protein ACOCTT_02060 [archaeon]